MSRYSGELRDFGAQIDEAANFLWENVSNHRIEMIEKSKFSFNFSLLNSSCDPFINHVWRKESNTLQREQQKWRLDHQHHQIQSHQTRNNVMDIKTEK